MRRIIHWNPSASEWEAMRVHLQRCASSSANRGSARRSSRRLFISPAYPRCSHVGNCASSGKAPAGGAPHSRRVLALVHSVGSQSPITRVTKSYAVP